MKSYSMEFRIAVAKAYDECGSSLEVADQFNCSASWIRRLIQRRELTDSLSPLAHRHPDNRKLHEPELERLRQLIADKPDMTLGELAAALDAGGNSTTLGTGTIHITAAPGPVLSSACRLSCR